MIACGSKDHGRVSVYVDDQISTLQRYGGVSRYFAEIMREFRRDSDHGVQLLNGREWSLNHHMIDAGFGRRFPGRVGRSKRILRRANALGAALRRSCAHVMHHSFYEPEYLRPDSNLCRIVTVYDMIPERLPHLFPAGNPHLAKREYVNLADLVLAISNSTKRDIIEVYGQLSIPIVVTPLGVSDTFFTPQERPSALPPRYVLFLGRRRGYKDFDVLVRAFAAADLPEDVHLVAIGGPLLSPDERSKLTDLGIRGRVVHVALDDSELPGAYRHALCFVFPSRYEGFGLPTLEAMAAGCATVLCDSSSHPEVGGEAALYFDPGDDSELAAHLESLVANPELRRSRGELSVEHARHFSWARTAQLTANAYRQALQVHN